MSSRLSTLWLLAALLLPQAAGLRAQIPDAQILGVPDYDWYGGCFGTACGNLMGYWDRNGFPDFYTGATAGGVAPLDASGANIGIRSMWASRAGFDGRPGGQPGHVDDYWRYYANDYVFSYEDTGADPYVLAGRPEHAPDCIGDFIGLSQKKFTNMNNECDGNIDAYSFVYWATNGERRTNFTQAVDIQSGLRAWAKFRGYDTDVFTQLAEFNPRTPPGKGFTWADLKAEIDAGFPLLIFLQNYDQMSRSIGSLPRVNPDIHGMLAIGYEESEAAGAIYRYVYVRTSWGSGEGIYRSWSTEPWLTGSPSLHVRGVIGFHPRPKIRSITRQGTALTLRWDGPVSRVPHYDQNTQAYFEARPHRFQLRRSPVLSADPRDYAAFGPVTKERTITVDECCGGTAFYRVMLLAPP